MKSDYRQHGFTLIEVLVAFAIAAVAFIAMFSGLQNIVNSTSLMQERTFATWVAYDQITELRLAGQFPAENKLQGEVEMAGTEWLYTVRVNSTQSADMRQLIVEVAPVNDPGLTMGRATGVVHVQSVGGTSNNRGQSGGRPGGAPGAGASSANFGNSGALLIASAPGSFDAGTDPDADADANSNPDFDQDSDADGEPKEIFKGQEH